MKKQDVYILIGKDHKYYKRKVQGQIIEVDNIKFVIIGEEKIRHIFNLGLTEYRRIQNDPRKIGSKPYFPESVYVEFLQEKINRLKFENNQLKMKLDDIEDHIPHID